MQQQDYASQMQVRKSKNGLKSTEISRFLFAHNPEAVGSNPTSATKEKSSRWGTLRKEGAPRWLLYLN